MALGGFEIGLIAFFAVVFLLAAVTFTAVKIRRFRIRKHNKHVMANMVRVTNIETGLTRQLSDPLHMRRRRREQIISRMEEKETMKRQRRSLPDYDSNSAYFNEILESRNLPKSSIDNVDFPGSIRNVIGPRTMTKGTGKRSTSMDSNVNTDALVASSTALVQRSNPRKRTLSRRSLRSKRNIIYIPRMKKQFPKNIRTRSVVNKVNAIRSKIINS